jgi:hypothetical protein
MAIITLGANAITALPASISTGKILQVKSTIKTDATSTTSTSYADITGLSVAITPSASSSKIFTLFNINVSNTQLGRDDFIRLMRGSTAIVDPFNYFREGNSADFLYNANGNFLDSPSSTSELTYKLQWKIESGTGYLNRRGDHANVNTASSITVMEIAV